MDLRLIVISDNNKHDPRLRTEWGFSCLVETPEKTILFDTGGNSDILLGNMEKLEISPSEVDIVVLSHIHEDHVGGLAGFLEENSDVSVYLPSSFPFSFKNGVKSSGASVEEITAAGKLFPGVYSTGVMGTGMNEQALVITSAQGLVVITGCAHPGIVNITAGVRDMLAEEPIFLLIGGFHLSWSSDSSIASIIKKLRQSGVVNLAPCHCSGDKARQLFREEYRDNFIDVGAGKIISLCQD